MFSEFTMTAVKTALSASVILATLGLAGCQTTEERVYYSAAPPVERTTYVYDEGAYVRRRPPPVVVMPSPPPYWRPIDPPYRRWQPIEPPRYHGGHGHERRGGWRPDGRHIGLGAGGPNPRRFPPPGYEGR